MTEWSLLLLNDMVASGPELQLRAMPGFVALLQPVSGQMSDAPGAIEFCADTQDQGPT